MLSVSDDYKYFAQRCTRHPVVSAVVGFDRMVVDYTNMTNVDCDIVSVDWTSQADSPVASIVKSYADITFSNTNGKYMQYLDNTLDDCDGNFVKTADVLNVTPGLKTRIKAGFGWDKNMTGTFCGHYKEYANQFTGRSDKFPSYTTEDGGRSLATIHFVDDMDRLLGSATKFQKVYTGWTVGQALTDWFTTAFGEPIVIPDNGAIPLGTLVIEPETDIFGDYLRQMVEINGGRFYIDVNGIYHYDTNAYINSLSATPDVILGTCEHILDISSPSLDNVYNIVKVQQFANPGGIEYTGIDSASVSQYGPHEIVITNPLIPNQSAAKAIADRVLAFYANSTYDREIEIIGLGWLQVYDKVLIRERVESDVCSSCKCRSLYSETIYRINKIYSRIDGDNGFTQKLTLTRSPLIENTFIACESETCNNQIGVKC